VKRIINRKRVLSFLKNKSEAFRSSALGKKLLFSILLFSTIITLFLTTLQIYLDYKKGVDGIYSIIDQIRLTQIESLAQNLWSINNAQIKLQLKGLLEIKTINQLTIFPEGEEPILLKKDKKAFQPIITKFPIIYERDEEKIKLGSLEIISDIGPVYKELESRVLVILMSQGAKTFLVSFFILFIFNILVNKHIIAMKHFAHDISLKNIGRNLTLERSPLEERDELDDLAKSLNVMQSKIKAEIEQRKNYERQLQQSQKMEALGTLASGIAHDFNNILQGLYNALFLLEEEVIDNADALERLEAVTQLTDRAKELVRQILIFTRQEEGTFSKFPPLAPIQDVVEILRVAAFKDIDIDLIIDPPKGQIYGDPTQIKQVILNLGNNAIHSLENIDKPSIRIKLSPVYLADKVENDNKGHFLKIEVLDNGSGIEKVILDRVFEPFFTTKEVGKGTGLGLSVVHGIVERHFGFVEVESVVGVGSTFRVFFPLYPSNQKVDPNAYSGDELTIIVGDSNQRVEKLIKKLGHKVVIINNEENALHSIKKFIKDKQTRESLIIAIGEGPLNYSPEELIRKLRQLSRKPIIINIASTEELSPSLRNNLDVIFFAYDQVIASDIKMQCRNLRAKLKQYLT